MHHINIDLETRSGADIQKTGSYKYLQDPDFRNRYDSMSGILLSTAAASMTDAVGSAVQTLRSVLDDPEAAPGVKVSAADALLRHTARYVELGNVLRRIEALEKTQQEAIS